MPLILKSLAGGVAVITGGASGLGYAMAEEARQYGMHVVLTDIRKGPLDDAISRLKKAPGPEVGGISCRVVGALCDVGDPHAFEAVHNVVRELQHELRTAAPRQYTKDPPIQLLAANAGVLFPRATVLTGSPKEWETTYRVNVLGVVNTLQAFVPAMVRQSEQSLVVVTGSVAGLLQGSVGPYGSSKLATVGVAEALHKELSEADGSPLRRISVVALCPAIVRTEILTSSATHFADERSGDPTALSRLEAVLDKGMLPTVAVREVFRHAAAGKFYCIVDNDVDRDGMTLGVDNGISERYAGMMSRSIDRGLKAKL